KTEPYRAREFSPTSTPPEGLSKSLSELLAILESLGSATLSELNLRGFNANQVNALIKRGLIEEKSITPPKFTPLRSKFDKRVYSAPYSSLFERIHALSESANGSLIIISQNKPLLKELANYLAQMASKNILSITTDEKPENLYSNYFSAQAKSCVVLSQEAGFFLPAFSLEKIILLGNVDEPFFMLLSENLCKELSIPLYHLDISSKLFFLKDAAELDLEEPNLLVVQRAPGEILTKKAKELIERDSGKRVLFLVSKSGYSYGYCKQCNSFAHCPVCQNLLTLNKDLSQAYCTSCGFSSEALCPECNSKLLPMGFGVQRLEEEAKILLSSSENFEFSTNPQKDGLYDLVIVANADPILSVPRFNSLFNYLDYILRASRLSRSLTLVQTSEVSNPLLKGLSFVDMLKELLSEREKRSLPPYLALVETSCQIELPKEAHFKTQRDKLYISIPRSHLSKLMSTLSKCPDVKLFLE
ncbi:MAG: hypothetical protein RMJ32_05070, partial [Aquificaceae bacterium]|nr:hypothetical protein [Aquificaceae bacterium]